MVNLTPEQQEALVNIAYERSEPGDRVSISSVAREAIIEYLNEDNE